MATPSLNPENTSTSDKSRSKIQVILLFSHVTCTSYGLTAIGGMPTPSRPIPFTFAFSDSDWLVPVDGEEGQAYLRSSIPEGQSDTVQGSIKVLIRERRNGETPPIGEELREETKLSIKATMPWLNRDLPGFEICRAIDIQYPCRLQNFDQLATVALGSRNIVKFEV